MADWHPHRTPTQALSHEKLAQGQAKNAVGRTHHPVMGRLAQGFPASEIAAVTGKREPGAFLWPSALADTGDNTGATGTADG